MKNAAQPVPRSRGIQSLSTAPHLRAGRRCLAASLVLAQAAWLQASPAPMWEWAAQAGGPEHDAGYRVAVDGEGNTCIVGTFWNTLTVGTNTLTCTEGASGFFVAKYDPTGRVLWAQAAESPPGAAYGFRLATDREGNVYLTGLFRGRVHIGSFTLQAEPWRDCVLLVKCHPDGQVLWARQADGVSEDSNHYSVVDAAGNLYLSGTFMGQAQIGPYQLNSRGGYDVFVARYDPAGVVQWVQQAGGTDFDGSQGLSADAAGHVYVTGNFSGTARFGETNVVSSAGHQDVFLAAYDCAGGLLWVMTGGGAGYDYGYRIAVNAAGEVYLAGQFREPATFGSATVVGGSWNNGFLLKCSPAGQVLWATTVGNADSGGCQDLRLDPAGHVVVLGWFEGWAEFGTNWLVALGGYDAFVARYDPAGEILWAVAAGDNGNEVSSHLGLDAQGHVYLTGGFGGAATVGTNELFNPRQAVFLAKLDPAGEVRWTTQVSGCAEGNVYADDVVVDAAGGVYIHGHFDREVAFGPDCFTSPDTDLFVAKLAGDPVDPRIALQPQSQTQHIGTTARLHVLAGGAWPRSCQWFKDGTALDNRDRLTGATGPILKISRLEPADAGDYTVTVSNAFGVVTSAVAVLTVDPAPLPPAFREQPEDLAVGRGENATFLVVVTGSEPFTYQWQHHGVNLPEATNATLTLTAVQTNDAGTYTVVVSNRAGVAISAGATLTVLPITSLTEALDDYTLVWRSDPEHPWFGQTLVSHDGIDAAQSGLIPYEYSTWIETTVTGPGIIGFRWKICSPHDDDLDFEIDYNALAGIEGQTDWQRRLCLVPAGPHTLRWTFMTEEVGSLAPRTAWLDEVSFTTNDPGPPVILVGPRNQYLAEGDDARFSVEAEGLDPLTYRWEQNGVALGSDRDLALTEVTPAQAGAYSVLVSSPAGETTSPAATLTVGPPIVRWDWARTAARADYAEATRLAVDAGGNIYMTGQFGDTADFGTHRLASRGGADIFLAKYNRAGQLLWAQRAGSPDADTVDHLALDAAGHVILSGFISDGADFGPFTLATSNVYTIFLAKYHANGTVLWARAAGNGGLGYVGSMAVDPAGNVYCAGQVYDAWFGDFHLTQTGSGPDAFLIKCSDAGEVLWARQVSGPETERIHDLAADGAGHVYVSATFGSAVTLGTNELRSERDYPDDCFLAQFDAEGNVLWARLAHTNQFSPYNLAVDAADRLYLGAYFHDALVVGAQVLTADGADDFFLAQCDSAGQVNWVKRIQGLSNDYAERTLRLAVDRAGYVYVKGDFREGLRFDEKFLFTITNWWPGEAFVAQFDPAGHPLWARRVGGSDPYSGNDWRPTGFAVDAGGGVYLSGTFSQPIGFGTNTLAPAGPRDIYLAKLGSTVCCRLDRSGFNGGTSLCRVTLTGLAGRSPVILEVSTDLVTWQPVCTNALPGQTFEFTEPLCSSQPARFYRAVVGCR